MKVQTTPALAPGVRQLMHVGDDGMRLPVDADLIGSVALGVWIAAQASNDRPIARYAALVGMASFLAALIK